MQTRSNATATSADPNTNQNIPPTNGHSTSRKSIDQHDDCDQSSDAHNAGFNEQANNETPGSRKRDRTISDQAVHINDNEKLTTDTSNTTTSGTPYQAHPETPLDSEPTSKKQRLAEKTGPPENDTPITSGVGDHATKKSTSIKKTPAATAKNPSRRPSRPRSCTTSKPSKALSVTETPARSSQKKPKGKRTAKSTRNPNRSTRRTKTATRRNTAATHPDSAPTTAPQQQEVEPDDEEEEELSEEEEEEINESTQAVEMLEALMGMEVLDDFTRGELAITEATRLNLEMQQQVKEKLRWIDERIRVTQEMMREAHSLSSKEIFAGDKPSKIYKTYPGKIDYFVDDDGNHPVLNKRSDLTDIGAIMKRTWTAAERRRLFGAIHAEAQRAFVLDIMAKGEEHRIWEIDKMDKRELEMVSVDRLDWNRISTLYVKTRSPTQCIIQWTTQEHPSINKKPWSNAESRRLMQLVEEHSIYGKWDVIAREHNSNRTASQCFSHYQALRNTKISKKKWTAEEDAALKEAVSLLGERNWQQVASLFVKRTGNQCLQRWMKSINPAIRREKWNSEEDEILQRAVQVYGAGNWTRIQKHLPGRTDMQVRERYMNILDPTLNLEPATEEEEERLWELVQTHGRKWSMLTEYFPGRTDNRLLRMFKAAEKRRKQKAQQDEQTE